MVLYGPLKCAGAMPYGPRTRWANWAFQLGYHEIPTDPFSPDPFVHRWRNVFCQFSPDLEIGSLFSKVWVFCTQLFSPPRQIVSGRVRRAFNSHQVLRLRNENNSVHVRLHSSTIDFIGDLVYPIIRETEYSKTHESMEIARS